MDKYMVDAVETFQSEYEMTWNLPKVDYNHFRLIGTDSNQNIVGGYEPTKGTSLFGIKVGTNRSAVTSKYCDPISGVAFNSNASPYYTINFYRK